MPPALDLTLTPNRSFDRDHARWLVMGVGAIFFLGGLRFLALGAWPILPFMAADVRAARLGVSRQLPLGARA